MMKDSITDYEMRTTACVGKEIHSHEFTLKPMILEPTQAPCLDDLVPDGAGKPREHDNFPAKTQVIKYLNDERGSLTHTRSQF